MTDPIVSDYDKDPVNTKPDLSEDKDAPEPEAPDLGNTKSPDLEVWAKRPSFNDDPKPIEHGGEEPKPDEDEGLPASGFNINLKATASQLNNMLGYSRELVTDYEALRKKVLATKGTIWGQDSKETDPTYSHTTSGMVANQPTGEDPSEWAEPAKKFADQMNPSQEKALQYIGSVLELVGEFIALANHSGQAYAEADRNSRFPEPPAK